MFPLRGLVPVKMNGLIGASKNIGVSSMVQSALRLHGQMMHVGTAAVLSPDGFAPGLEPREIAASPRSVRALQRTLVRGTSGPGTLLWPWHDLKPDELHFEAANILSVIGVWRADRDSLFFRADQAVTRRELAASLVRLCRVMEDAKAWPKYSDQSRFSDVLKEDPDRAYLEAFAQWSNYPDGKTSFKPNEVARWGTLNEWLSKLNLPVFPALVSQEVQCGQWPYVLTRASALTICTAFSTNAEKRCTDSIWLRPGGDHDGDGRSDFNDALPFDRDNNSIPTASNRSKRARRTSFYWPTKRLS